MPTVSPLRGGHEECSRAGRAHQARSHQALHDEARPTGQPDPAESLQPLEPNGLELTANALRDSGIRSDGSSLFTWIEQCGQLAKLRRPAENPPS